MNYVRALNYLLVMMRRLHWKEERLLAYQNKRLKEIIRYAFDNSRYYREKFKSIGVKPENIKGTKDLVKLPIIRKTEIVRNIKDVLSKEFQLEKLKVRSTSGSTGRALHVYLTSSEDEFRKAKHLRAQMVLGQKSWDKWVTITSPVHFAETSRLQRMAHFFSTYPVSVFDNVEVQIDRICHEKPGVLDGYSNSIYLLTKEMQKRGLDPFNIKFLVGGAEPIDSRSRMFVEDYFGKPFYDQYATVEFDRIAWQCREKHEYHIDADSIIVEFVDQNGEEVAPGEDGEIVCTSLFNHAMPFIRYALDDVGVPSGKTDCDCHRSFPMMKLIEGRKNSIFTLPGGRSLAPVAVTEAVLTSMDYKHIDLFRVIQKREDLLVFKLKLNDDFADPQMIESRLIKHLKHVLNLSDDVLVEVEFVDDIPLDKTGKFTVLISELNLKK